MLLLGWVLGVASVLPVVVALVIALDRRDERRRRIALRVDQTPAPLPGAYAPASRPQLVAPAGTVVLDQEPIDDGSEDGWTR